MHSLRLAFELRLGDGGRDGRQLGVPARVRRVRARRDAAVDRVG